MQCTYGGAVDDKRSSIGIDAIESTSSQLASIRRAGDYVVSDPAEAFAIRFVDGFEWSCAVRQGIDCLRPGVHGAKYRTVHDVRKLFC